MLEALAEYLVRNCGVDEAWHVVYHTVAIPHAFEVEAVRAAQQALHPPHDVLLRLPLGLVSFLLVEVYLGHLVVGLLLDELGATLLAQHCVGQQHNQARDIVGEVFQALHHAVACLVGEREHYGDMQVVGLVAHQLLHHAFHQCLVVLGRAERHLGRAVEQTLAVLCACGGEHIQQHAVLLAVVFQELHRSVVLCLHFLLLLLHLLGVVARRGNLVFAHHVAVHNVAFVEPVEYCGQGIANMIVVGKEEAYILVVGYNQARAAILVEAHSQCVEQQDGFEHTQMLRPLLLHTVAVGVVG